MPRQQSIRKQAKEKNLRAAMAMGRACTARLLMYVWIFIKIMPRNTPKMSGYPESAPGRLCAGTSLRTHELDIENPGKCENFCPSLLCPEWASVTERRKIFEIFHPGVSPSLRIFIRFPLVVLLPVAAVTQDDQVWTPIRSRDRQRQVRPLPQLVQVMDMHPHTIRLAGDHRHPLLSAHPALTMLITQNLFSNLAPLLAHIELVGIAVAC